MCYLPNENVKGAFGFFSKKNKKKNIFLNESSVCALIILMGIHEIHSSQLREKISVRSLMKISTCCLASFLCRTSHSMLSRYPMPSFSYQKSLFSLSILCLKRARKSEKMMLV